MACIPLAHVLRRRYDAGMRFIKFCIFITGLGLFIIGLARIPEDWATWKEWLKPVVELVNHDIARWAFAIIGFLVVTSIMIYPRLRDFFIVINQILRRNLLVQLNT